MFYTLCKEHTACHRFWCIRQRNRTEVLSLVAPFLSGDWNTLNADFGDRGPGARPVSGPLGRENVGGGNCDVFSGLSTGTSSNNFNKYRTASTTCSLAPVICFCAQDR